MTTDRIDQHSTEYGLWVRGFLRKKVTNADDVKFYEPEVIQKVKVDCIDSMIGFRNTNLDYIWSRGPNFILIEEKRFKNKGEIKQFQFRSYAFLDRLCEKSEEYGGCWILRFENTNPEDGKIYLSKLDRKLVKGKYIIKDESEIPVEELLYFLSLEWMSKPKPTINTIHSGFIKKLSIKGDM